MLSRFSRPLPAPPPPPPPPLPLSLGRLLLPSFASSHLQSLILLPPHIFLHLLDVSNPLILFISHALGSSLSSPRFLSHLHLRLSFPSFPFVPPSTYFAASVPPPPSPLQSPLSAIVCHHPVITAPRFLFFPPSLTCPSVTFLPSPAVLIMAALPSFYLSVRQNVSSPHPFIITLPPSLPLIPPYS